MWDYHPPSTSLALAKEDELFDAGLTMGTLYIGRQGTGKTTALARHLVDYFKRYPDRAVFVLDWSGSITDAILTILLGGENSEDHLKRVVYDELGNPDWVVPMPEFSLAYGGTYEDHVQRVTGNISKLANNLTSNASVLGDVAINDIGPHFLRLLTATTTNPNDQGETWQITEASRLMEINNEPLLRRILNTYGSRLPETQRFLNSFLDTKAQERDMRTYTLRSKLSITGIPEIRARLGYYRPGWTPKDAIEKGKLVLIDGARLIGQEKTQHYLFTQIYSLIMAEMKRRRPADPKDKPVSLILDEVYSLISIPGMAVELSQLSPQYRSRKLQLYIVLQELAQMSEELRPHVWSLGNVVSFALANFNEAYEVSQQLCKYDPRLEKLPALSDRNHPVLETDRGQYLEIANWIQSMVRRECIMRRYIDESKMDKHVAHVKETKSTKTVHEISRARLDEVKQTLLEKNAIRIREALDIVNRRVQPASNPFAGRQTID